jgi:hypothetical protein
MGGMPNWFAKTKEMVASDLYFSLRSAKDEQDLAERYRQALVRLQDRVYYSRSDALSNTTTKNWKPADAQHALEGHFRGDWIHPLYGKVPGDPTKYADVGGRFWPQVPSWKVAGRVRLGTRIAIQKALGITELRQLGYDQGYIDAMYEAELENGVDIDGVRPLATSWNCVAPPGDTYFEVDALRGPTVVEFAIATPRPMGHAVVHGLVEEFELGLRAHEDGRLLSAEEAKEEMS